MKIVVAISAFETGQAIFAEKMVSALALHYEVEGKEMKEIASLYRLPNQFTYVDESGNHFL